MIKNLHLHFTFFSDKIENFIDENKALFRRMFGEFPSNPTTFEVNDENAEIDEPDFADMQDPIAAGSSYFGKLRKKRQLRSRANGSLVRVHESPTSIPKLPRANNLTSER